MSLSWYQIAQHLALHCTMSAKSNIRDILLELYQDKGLSVSQITDLTKGEASCEAIRRKLLEFKIPLRGRGGANYCKLGNIPDEDWLHLSKEDIAFKYSVSLWTVKSHYYQWRKNHQEEPLEDLSFYDARDKVTELFLETQKINLTLKEVIKNFDGLADDLTKEGLLYTNGVREFVKEFGNLLYSYSILMLGEGD